MSEKTHLTHSFFDYRGQKTVVNFCGQKTGVSTYDFKNITCKKCLNKNKKSLEKMVSSIFARLK